MSDINLGDINLDVVFDLARNASKVALKTESNLARRDDFENVLDYLKPFENRHIEQLGYHHGSFGIISTDARK